MKRRHLGVFAQARRSVAIVSGGAVKGTWNLTDTGWTWSDFLGTGERRAITVREAYRQVAAMKRCIDLRGRALSRVPFDIEKRGTDTVLWESEKQPTGDLERLSGLKLLLRQWGSSLAATGAGYGLKDRKSGPNIRVTYANPLNIQVVKTDDGPVYKRKVGAKYVTVPPELMIPIFSPDWAIEQGSGSPDASAGLLNAQVLYELHSFLSAHLRGGLVKATALTWTGEDFPEDDEEVAEIESWWKSFLAKSKDQVEPRLIDSRVKPEVIGEGMRDLRDVAMEDAAIAAIAMALGVPLSVLKSEAANFATALVDRWSWHEDTILPDAEVVGDAMNEHLFAGMGLEIVWKPERSPIFRALEKETAVSEVAEQPTSEPEPEPSRNGVAQPADVEGDV